MPCEPVSCRNPPPGLEVHLQFTNTIKVIAVVFLMGFLVAGQFEMTGLLVHAIRGATKKRFSTGSKIELAASGLKLFDENGRMT